jgi:Protein of unknown function (DUF4019)
MGMIRWLAISALLLFATGCDVALAEDVDTSGGMSAANAWLALVDGERYGESWDAAAERFRAAMDRAKWEATVQSARGPLGLVVTRKIRTVAFTHSLPNAPEGEYVVVQFDTRFQNRPLAEEMITSEREKDGTWRVAGYWIR